MKRTIFLKNILFLMTLLMFAGVAGGETGTIKVGLLTPITGLNPDWGKKQTIGMKVAVEAVNRRGGINGVPVEAVVYDTGSDSVKTATAYRKMAREDKVLATIGPLFSGTFKALSPLTSEEKVVIIATASSAPGLSDLTKRPYAFRMTVTSEKKESHAVKAWVSAHQVRKVVILYDRKTTYTRTLAEKVWPKIFNDLNIEIVNLTQPVSFMSEQQDFSEVVEKAGAFGADGICIAAMPQDGGLLLKELREQGLTQAILGGSSMATPTVIEIAGAAAEGLWSNSLFVPGDVNPRSKKYLDAFKQACSKEYPGLNCEPEQFDVVVHDTLHFIADIMKKKRITGVSDKLDTERDAIRNGLVKMGVWRGTAGMMAFDKKGDGIRTVHIIKVENGKWEHLRHH